MNEELQLYNEIFMNLIGPSFTPQDTTNLITSIYREEYEDYYTIVVTAPSKYGDYASYVNEKKTPNLPTNPKNPNRVNYHFVERAVAQAVGRIQGDKKYEL